MGGGANPTGEGANLLFDQFCSKLHKNEKNWTLGRTPPLFLDPSMTFHGPRGAWPFPALEPRICFYTTQGFAAVAVLTVHEKHQP